MKRCIIIAVPLVVILASCQTQGPKASVGTFMGAGAGALIGSQLGHGDGRVAGALVGAVIGGLFGNQLGNYLDEVDKQNLTRITRQTLISGRSSRFHNKRSGVSATARMASTKTSSDGSVCRTVDQEVTLKDGRISRDTVSACKGKNGWTI
jgi:uncharacterized protein YcfJ